MANMSYCRFQNTSIDLADCKDALEALLAGDAIDGPISEPLSREELAAARRLVDSCFAIVRLVAEFHAIDLDIDGAFSKAENNAHDALDHANEEFSKED